MRRLGVTIAAALVCLVYAGVCSAKDSSGAEDSLASAVVTEEGESEAIAQTSEPASSARKGKKSTEPVAKTTEPVSAAPETSTEPVAETTEPVTAAPETPTEPVAETSEPGSDAGAVSTAKPLTHIPIGLSSSPFTTRNIDVLPMFLDFAPALSADVGSVASSDRRGRKEVPTNDDPSPLPGPGPESPVPAGPAGASAASGGGSSGGFIALAAFLLLASLPLSRVVEQSLTRMRTPRLVADLARPG